MATETKKPAAKPLSAASIKITKPMAAAKAEPTKADVADMKNSIAGLGRFHR